MLTESDADDSCLDMHCPPHPAWLVSSYLNVSCDDVDNFDGRGTMLYGCTDAESRTAFGDDGMLGWLKSDLDNIYGADRMFSRLFNRFDKSAVRFEPPPGVPAPRQAGPQIG